MVLKIRTNGKAGEKLTQVATVYTDDPEHAIIPLTLTGQVLPPADIRPQAARLMGTAGRNIEARITISPQPGNPFTIVSASAENGENIRFQVRKQDDTKNTAFLLVVANQKTTPGRYADKIILKTTSPISPELQIRVYGIIRGDAPATSAGP